MVIVLALFRVVLTFWSWLEKKGHRSRPSEGVGINHATTMSGSRRPKHPLV
jgi:hypothetical protein